MDSNRHNMVTLVSMGEVNVVETLNSARFGPGHKAQGQGSDPQGQVGE